MAANDLYILPENVALIPVNEIAEQSRSKFEYEDDDFVITYNNGRQTSKVIDGASASLLKTFKTPSSLVEGIFKYSVLNNLNAEDTVEQAYSLLARFRSEGFLVVYDEKTTGANKGVLQPGDAFNGYTIVEKIQGIEDTEVYKVQKKEDLFVVKFLKENGKSNLPQTQFDNEVNILQLLDNTINPALVESGTFNSSRYIVMEWFNGIPCDNAVEKYHNLNNPDNLLCLLQLACNILDAYIHLHSQGIIHSDIHPRNILVSNSDEVRIIDFGLARIATQHKFMVRGGIGFFYEPEYAASVLENKQQAATSFAGEQYAIAALIYFLLAGKHYLNFSYERDILLEQILQQEPISFTAYDLDIDPQIEIILRKALAKKPEDRYSSIKELKHALASTIRSAKESSISNEEARHSSLAFCESIKLRFGLNGNFIGSGLQLAPFGSVNYGDAGIAYMFYRMALIESNPELLAVADIWVNHAMDYIENEEAAFYAKEIDITKNTVGEISIYHTASGVHLMQALVSKAFGQHNRYYAGVSNFMAASSKVCNNPDLTLGKSSILVGSAILIEQMNDEQTLKEQLIDFGNRIVKDIWDVLQTYTAISANEAVNYRGIAHGWAGILYATLRWCAQSNTVLPDSFYKRVDELISLGIAEKDYLRWNITAGNAASWTGWCHGSAGYTFLWCAMYTYSKDEKYLELAQKTARHFLTETGVTNVSLCCGLSGECYALLRLFNITKNEYYLLEAKNKAKKILHNVYTPDARNNSLYKGDIGAAVLLTELNKPCYARMPLFE